MISGMISQSLTLSFILFLFYSKEQYETLFEFNMYLDMIIRCIRRRYAYNNLPIHNMFSELQKSSCRLEEERCSSPPIALNSQVTELIAQMRDGLQIKDVKSSQLIEIFQEKVQLP